MQVQDSACQWYNTTFHRALNLVEYIGCYGKNMDNFHFQLYFFPIIIQKVSIDRMIFLLSIFKFTERGKENSSW